MIPTIILGYICLSLITYLIVKRIFKPGIRHVSLDQTEDEWFYISESTTTKTAIMSGILWPLTLIGAIFIGIIYLLGFKPVIVKKY